MQKYLNHKTLYLSLIMLCLVSLCGAIVYRFYSLNNIGVAISLILAIVLFIIILKFYRLDNRPASAPADAKAMAGKQQETNTKDLMLSWVLKPSLTSNLLLITYVLLLITSFFILFISQTDESIISPWQVIPNYFFLLYGLATAILIIIIAKRPGNNIAIKQYIPIILISLHYFLSFSAAWIVYKIGYGFDPFIHQATMDLIDKTGAVHPKPFYYLGQYSLIIILNKITFIPIEWLNKLLVPVMAAIYLPAIAYHALSKWFEDNKVNLLLVTALLIFPFSFFILTTPQNLAYLLLILIIFLGLSCSNIYELAIIYLLSFTAMLIQPIAGIPAILFAVLLTVFHDDKAKTKKYFYLLIFLLSIITLPIAFLIFENGYNISDSLKIAEETSRNILSLFKFNMPGQENFILNFIYLYWFNLKIIIGLISAAGIIIAFRSLKLCRLFMLYLIMSISLLASYAITKKLSFGFLIEYERGDYPDRILTIAIFFLAPFIIISLYWLINRILKQNKLIKLIFLIFSAILISTSLYLSYPRFDHYFNSRCFSTSENDISAVNWINNQAENDYIVLANQQVSAAALREFGFKKYYSPPLIDKERGSGGEVFYYPIPTGGPLYQYYLDMVYEAPSRETMIKVMDMAGVSEGYFVLNKYWWAFDKILEEAKLEADRWEEIDNGEIFVFRYGR